LYTKPSFQVNQQNPKNRGQEINGLHPKLNNNNRYGVREGGNKNTDGCFIKPFVYIVSKHKRVEKKGEADYRCEKLFVMKSNIHKVTKPGGACLPKIE
jgi:hypothetical protein